MTDATRYFYPDRFAQQDWFIDPQGRPRKGKSTWIGAQHLPPLGCDPSFETRIRKFLEGDMTQTLKLMEDPLNTLGASVNLLLNADLESDKGLELVKGLSHKVLNLFPKSVDSEEDSVRIAAASLPLTEMELYSIHNLTRRLYGVWELANENPAIGEWDFHVKFGIPIEPNDAYQYRPRFPPEALQVHTDNFIEVSPRVEPSDRPRLNFVRFVHGVDETEKLEAQAAFLGMQWILNQQGEAGSWGLMDAKYGNYQPAITAQVLMLCSGFWPVPMESAASGPYVKGLRWLATQSLENGGKLADGLPEEVYQQAMAVQAMALALEVEKSKALGLALRDGANVLRTMQLPSGGWPEETGDTMEDLASTVAACIALSEAARVGITVEGGWMDRALNWANLEYQDDHWKVLEDGMPGLKPANQTSLSFQLGLLRCFAYGKDFPVSQRIELDTQVSLARPGRSTSADNLPLEYFLTGGLVIRQLSEEEWIKWQKANHEIVVGSQNRDGSWSPRNGPQDFQDPVKSTIEALGILQIDSHLPLVGRGGAENLRPNPQSDCKTSAGNSPKPFPAAILNRDFRPLILSSLPRRPLHLVAAVQGTR